MQREGGQVAPLELWGGIECTVNRVGDRYFDQLELNGHHNRLGDLDEFAALGLRTLRYPILWERIAQENGGYDWQWTDQRIQRLRELGIRPIAGLLHHGSGPRNTNLLADSFSEELARFAEATASRYPWIDAYTPVNEPLTTARFSGLYGHWYPHAKSDDCFVRALLNQCRGTILAMQAVRRIQPSAQLVQTENLDFCHSTPPLRYQANFENQRRWLSIDLLCGLVAPGHALFNYLRGAGASFEELDWFRANAIPPDILGWNYYLTSERFLDHRLAGYPPDTHGGNGRERYADVEAVWVRSEGMMGPKPLLMESWERYSRPMAITESHLGSHREAQLRWLVDAWQSAIEVRQLGVDLRAVTVWSLLGTFNWNTLCTRDAGFYEPGVFDLRGGAPRPTAIATLARQLIKGRGNYHPATPERGWWEHDSRLRYRAVATGPSRTTKPVPTSASARPLLITGAAGTLGQGFAHICRDRGLAHMLKSRAEMDITNLESVEQTILSAAPWAVINAAGYVRVDDAECDARNCEQINTVGAANLASVCAKHGLPLLTFSSDLVFDGSSHQPYIERDAVGPLGVYGRTKADAEKQVLALHPQALVIRTSAFFGPWDAYNFLTVAMRRLAAGLTVTAADDWIVSPTYIPDLAHAALDLLIDGEHGIWHLANSGGTSWADFARAAAMEAGLEPGHVRGCSGEDFQLTAVRPMYSVLGSERGMHLPPLTDAVRRYSTHMRHQMHEYSQRGA